MDYKDYYAIMGLKQDASPSDIKMAYRRLARKYHPDLNKEPKAEEKFKELGEAYDVLKDPEKRKTYDQYKHNWEFNQQARSSQQRQTHNWQDMAGDYQYSRDFFESLFGGAYRSQQMNGADLHGTISISLEDAYKGIVKSIQLPGSSQMAPPALNVKIPAGIKSGQQIRLAGQGAESLTGGTRGDLYLTVDVEKHPIYDVLNDDVYVTLPVAPWEVALGATVKVPTLGGMVDLKIPPGSQGGQRLRLKQRGLSGATPGDQYIILKIITPPPTSEEAKLLYKKMSEQMPFNPREKMGV